MDIEDIKLNQKVTFRTMRMNADTASHSGAVEAIHDGAKGPWVEIKKADGTSLRTRAALVSLAS